MNTEPQAIQEKTAPYVTIIDKMNAAIIAFQQSLNYPLEIMPASVLERLRFQVSPRTHATFLRAAPIVFGMRFKGIEIEPLYGIPDDEVRLSLSVIQK